MKTCIIAGAGEYRKEDLKAFSYVLKMTGNETVYQKGQYDKETLLLAADGGYRIFKKNKQVPHALIGDFDSIPFNIKNKIFSKKLDVYKNTEIVRYSAEKDDTDMIAAIRYGLQKGCKQFHLFGGCGKRTEHTIANIACLSFLKENGACGFLYGDNHTYTVIKNEKLWFPECQKKYLSVFAVGEAACGVTLVGVKYPLKNAVLSKNYPMGVSNEFLGNEVEVSVVAGELLLVF